MNADTLANLSRSEIVSLAKENKIKGNVSNKEIIRQLLARFPEGVPVAAAKAPGGKAKAIVGRVKNAFKNITRGGSPPRGQRESSVVPAAETVAAAVLETPSVAAQDAFAAAENNGAQDTFDTNEVDGVQTEVSSVAAQHGCDSIETYGVRTDPDPSPIAPPYQRDVYVPDRSRTAPVEEPLPKITKVVPPSLAPSYDEDESTPADPEDVRRLIADMAAISARNKLYAQKAAALRAQAEKLHSKAADYRAALVVQQARRQRLGEYIRYWRAVDPAWGYSAMWAGDVTLAPVLARFEHLKGGVVMDLEVTTSDDEELVQEWHVQDGVFRARRERVKAGKARRRGVDVEMVSDEETASDEEAFYSPFVLRSEGDDGSTSDSEFHIHPLMHRSLGILFNRDDDIVIPQGRNTAMPRKRAREDVNAQSSEDGDAETSEDTDMQAEDKARYSPRPRVDKKKKKTNLQLIIEREQRLADIRGIELGRDGLGSYEDGWWMRSEDEEESAN
ncbi:hypothetical protein C8R43DRAFT_1165410 [Mycena crocata]|nr:hypothetical protein C8R43DRAFT_1165410 [Mycena crocata]